MDADQFDAFVRALPSRPRRPVVTGLLGAGLLSLLSRLTPDAAAGKKSKRKKRKRKKRKRKKRRRRQRNQECPPGQERCANECVDLLTDPDNCGACFNECVLDGCVNGACVCAEPDDCPTGCVCAIRKEGGEACAGDFDNASTCLSDADCPNLGSFCVGTGRCSIPCTG